MTTPKPYTPAMRNGRPNAGYRAGGRRWSGRDGRYTTAGENSRGAKLTEAQVRDIKSRPRGRGGQTDAQLAAEFGVGKSTVGAIRSGRSWGHVRVGDEGGVAS